MFLRSESERFCSFQWWKCGFDKADFIQEHVSKRTCMSSRRVTEQLCNRTTLQQSKYTHKPTAIIYKPACTPCCSPASTSTCGPTADWMEGWMSEGVSKVKPKHRGWKQPLQPLDHQETKKGSESPNLKLMNLISPQGDIHTSFSSRTETKGQQAVNHFHHKQSCWNGTETFRFNTFSIQ